MPETYSDIIEKVKKGDTASFTVLANEFKDKAFSLVMKILKNKEESEDALQEAFLKLYKAISNNKFEDRAKLSTYFYRIVYNTAIDHYKKLKARRFSIVSIDIDDGDFREGDDLLKKYYETDIETNVYEDRHEISTDKKISVNEIQKIIGKFISVIPEQYSVILTMFYINDLSHDEISDILKLPIGTVKNRIFRAKANLKEIILKKYPEKEILEYV
ncbi:MAG TPA: sigma-70 family RNA polymerase sigma factor [Ignavibacteria bacterium]|nr:sigma-70 family RNA polymerase sigma factor [Ignavibacteria bacterium]HMR40105.1 sigma-70 family RNA polymerase sigma factor [Ignavibacteria bacterium]